MLRIDHQAKSTNTQVDTDLPYLLVDEKHTVTTLRGKLANMIKAGHRDGCFPCLKRQEHSMGLGLVGILAVNELQHALGRDRSRSLAINSKAEPLSCRRTRRRSQCAVQFAAKSRSLDRGDLGTQQFTR